MVVNVVGHKNPDTDSICAAIAYAYLKNQISEDHFIPKKAGGINEETRYVLNRFGVEEPDTLTDVGAQVKDIDFRRTAGVDGHISLKKAWELMQENRVATLPIVSNGGHLDGIIVNGDIAYSYMDVYDNKILGRARTQYKNIIETLNATMVCGNEHAYFVKGKVLVLAGSHEIMRKSIEEDDLVILGNVREAQEIALDKNVSCMIICGETDVAQDIIDRAKSQQTVLMTTEYGSFTTARLIHQSMPISHFMTKEGIVSFDLDDMVDEVKETMSKVRHRDFPIFDDDRRYVGMMSRRNLLDMQKKRVILVDHNEKTQTVDNIDQADVLEIIDHHRLGSLETVSPIFFRNQPLGSTATIVAMMYDEYGVKIPEDMAGLLCSAILSDTLMFRSPTCTMTDEAIAKKLAEIAGIDIEEHATSMFEAGSDFKTKTTEEIFYQDFKIFGTDDERFGVAQVSAISKKQLASIKDDLQEFMNTVLVNKGVNMVFVMLTDILNEESEVLYLGSGAEAIIKGAFDIEPSDNSFILSGVVSRKKQLIPPIIEYLQS